MTQLKDLLLMHQQRMGNCIVQRDELISLILKFIRPWNKDNIEKYAGRGNLHILDIYRKSLVLRRSYKHSSHEHKLALNRKSLLSRLSLKKEMIFTRDYYIFSAMKLSESGISFELSETSNLNDISFRRGVLKLPLVIVDDMFESNYLNMMAFEKFHFGAGHQVAYHVCFMSTIINNARDVSLLISCGVLINVLGNDQAVADLFISMSRYVRVDPDSELDAVMFKMLDYCRSPLPSWMAYAKRNYFTNVWVGISFLAAILLFAVAGIQTVYTVIAYYDSKTRK